MQLIDLELDPTDRRQCIAWKMPTGTFILNASDVLNFLLRDRQRDIQG